MTLEAIRCPAELSYARRAFIGQPKGVDTVELRQLANLLETDSVRLRVIESPGHCDGHASLFDTEAAILFAGDSFMHTVFTAPNQDVSGDDWIETLERYKKWMIRTMVGTHGYVYSCDRSIPVLPFVVKRADPNEMISEKCEFLKWARAVVSEGERRRLSSFDAPRHRPAHRGQQHPTRVSDPAARSRHEHDRGALGPHRRSREHRHRQDRAGEDHR